MTLGQNIARLRAQKGYSQGDLADALEVSRQSVSKWETDASIPELDKLLRLAELFNVTLDELVKGKSLQEEADAPRPVPPAAPPSVHSRQWTVGVILLCFGLLTVLLFLLLGGGLGGLLFGAPFLLCGVILLTVKRRAGLWCGWATYLTVVGYLHFATGLSWTTIFHTFRWTASMNYVRLAVAWGMALFLFVMIAATLRSFRLLTIPCGKKQVGLIATGLLAVFAVDQAYSHWIAAFLRAHQNISEYNWVFTVGNILNFALDFAGVALLVLTAALYRAWREKKRNVE